MYNYPAAKHKPEEVRFGKHSVEDEYEWMRDAATPDTIAFTDSQNAFTDQYFTDYQSNLKEYLDEQREMSRNLRYREIV